MMLTELCGYCHLAPEIAELARQREFDERFLILDPDKERFTLRDRDRLPCEPDHYINMM